MNEAVASAPVLGRRSGLVALLLTFFLSAAGFAYVRRLGLGIAYALLPLLLMFVLGRTGVASTLAGQYVLLAFGGLLLVGGLVFTFRVAESTQADASPRWYNRWYHYLWIGLACVALGNVLVRHRGAVFGFESYRIPSESMLPTLQPGDFILADARSDALEAVQRGDIVTYIPREHPGQSWIARVVGLPGESIDTQGGSVHINGVALRESYVLAANEQFISITPPHVRATLGPDEYFLMGDNRDNADDSRFQGPVKRAALRSKLKAIWLSYSPTTRTIETERIGNLPSAHAR